jgi:undecaprenyl-diphosphatase
LLIAYYIFKKNRWLAVTVLSLALSSLGIMTFLKDLIKRNRPASPLVNGITNFSLPSGHAIMSVTFYGLLIWLIAINITNKWIKGILISVLTLLILSICFSRIYLRVHYTTDVIAGVSIGLLWLIICLWIINRIELRAINKNNLRLVNKP